MNEEKLKQINELNIQYETERKENEINMLNKNNELQAAEIDQQRLLGNFFMAGLIFISLVAVLLFRIVRYRKKVNRLLTQQKENWKN